MADINFNEPQYAVRSFNRRSWLANLMIKLGWATDDASAQKALTWVLIATLVLIAIIWLFII